MILVNIVNEPIGEVYQELLSFCQGRCHRFLLVCPSSDTSYDPTWDVFVSLQPHLICVEHRTSWPGTQAESPSNVYWYRVNPSSTAVLRTVSGLYDWQGPGSPEDLAFVRDDGRQFFTSISHENDAYLLLYEQELKDLQTCVPELQVSLDVSPEAFERFQPEAVN